jgi:transposase
MLTPADRTHLLRMMRRQTNSHVHRRMNTLLLLDDGWTAERIAEALFIDAETVREHRRLYETSGVTGVERLNYEGSDPALNETQLEALKAELDTRLYMTAKAVCDFVRRMFQVVYTPNAMTKLLKRLGFVYKKPKCVPAKADAAVQEKFATETLLPLMAQAGPNNPLYFADGMHPADRSRIPARMGPLLTFRRSAMPPLAWGSRAFPRADVPTFYKMGIS